MPRSVMMPLALAATLLLGATQARAQSVQITPFVGYAFGGSVRDSVLERAVSFDAALAYGGALSFPISESWRFELLYSRQQTKLAERASPPRSTSRSSATWRGFQEEKGEGKVRWFGTVWFGATRFVPGPGRLRLGDEVQRRRRPRRQDLPGEERGPAPRGPRLLHPGQGRGRRLLRERDVPLRVLRHRPVAGRRERGADPGLLGAALPAQRTEARKRSIAGQPSGLSSSCLKKT